MKTLNNRKVFLHLSICSLTDTQTEKIFKEYVLIDQMNHKLRIRPLSQLVPEKLTFLYLYNYAFCSPTDRLTDKIFLEQMRINKPNNQKKKNQTSILNSNRENHMLKKWRAIEKEKKEREKERGRNIQNFPINLT